MDVRVGLWRKLSTEELMLLNCGAGKDSWESLDCKEIQPVHSKGDQTWVFFGRNDAKVETPVLWPPHAKSWLIGKDTDAGRDWGQEEKGTTEDEMTGWHHRLDGLEFEWTPGDGNGQGGLACCDSWGRKESDTAEWLDWTELNWDKYQYICLGITWPQSPLVLKWLYFSFSMCAAIVYIIVHISKLKTIFWKMTVFNDIMISKCSHNLKVNL